VVAVKQEMKSTTSYDLEPSKGRQKTPIGKLIDTIQNLWDYRAIYMTVAAFFVNSLSLTKPLLESNEEMVNNDLPASKAISENSVACKSAAMSTSDLLKTSLEYKNAIFCLTLASSGSLFKL